MISTPFWNARPQQGGEHLLKVAGRHPTKVENRHQRIAIALEHATGSKKTAAAAAEGRFPMKTMAEVMGVFPLHLIETHARATE